MKHLRLLALAALLVGVSAASIAGERRPADKTRYAVVINHEEQYSIWFADRELPRGWKAAGFVGTREQALDHIEEVWTDMRPLSSRREVALKLYRQLKQKN